MAKLKNIIKELSEADYTAVYDGLCRHGAEKSAYLLQALRAMTFSDESIMEKLSINSNAYYTLRSRLNQKIEEYLLEQMESPRTDLLKKVANINEIVFTKKRTIAIATLKKLEKELKDRDLSNELTFVYKILKKLHINSSDYFTYSQLYNQHVAYMLAVDKAEGLLADYFNKFGFYTLTGDESDKLSLTLIHDEMKSNARLYDSHRLQVYHCCLGVFHRLFVMDAEEQNAEDLEPIEDILNHIQKKIFDVYKNDSIYFYLKLVFNFLSLEYYTYYKVHRKAEKYYEYVNEGLSNLLGNYTWYTYPPQFLHTKITRAVRLGTDKELYDENKVLFQSFELDKNNIPQYISYAMYRVISCHYVGKHEEAAQLINTLLNEIGLKRYPYAMLEIKSVLALEYCLMRDFELFNQLVNSIQRQIRIIGKENCEHISAFTKILRISISYSKKDKKRKIQQILDKMNESSRKLFSPTQYIQMNDDLLDKLCS